jgi:hypothetical protein
MLKRFFKRVLWLVMAVACGLVGVFFVRVAFERVQQMRTIERIPRVPVSALIPGEANLSGKVVVHAGKVLKGPDSGSPCVYFHYTVEKKTRDSDGDTKWETIENRYEHVPFVLEDDTGTIVVRPEHASDMTVSLASRHTRTSGDLRYNESRIDPGMTVFAMGLAQPGEHQGAGRLELKFKGPGNYVPILSVRGEEKERGTVGLYSLLLTGLGLLCLSLAIYALTRVAGINMTLVYLLLVALTVSITLTVQANRMIASDLRGAFERLGHEREVRAAEVRERLASRGVRWDGDWSALGSMLEGGIGKSALDGDTVVLISTHRVNLMRAMLRAERIRSGFPERLIARRMGLDPIEAFTLTDGETATLQGLEQVFQPSRIPALAAGILGGGGAVLALLFGALGMRRIRVKRWIENIPTVKAKGVVYGLNEVKGTVEMPEGAEALSGPLSGKPCSCYRYVIREKRHSGKKTEWVTIKDETRRKRFLCRDESGAFPVDPEGAEVVLKARTRKRQGRQQHEETRLEIGGPVYALGCAGIDPKTHDRLLMTRSEDARLPFLLSDRSEGELVARKAAVGFLLLNLGLNAFSMAGLSLAGWKGGFGVVQYQAAALAPLVYMVLFFLVVLFNDLVFLRQRCDAMWANIDVALKKRYDLLPKLATAAQAYTAHEQSLQSMLSAKRAGGGELAPDVAAVMEAEAAEAVRQVSGLFEAYPDLKADKVMQDLMGRIRDLEDEIALMREGYNQAVEIYNTRTHRIPDLLLARLGGFRERAFFAA